MTTNEGFDSALVALAARALPAVRSERFTCRTFVDGTGRLVIANKGLGHFYAISKRDRTYVGARFADALDMLEGTNGKTVSESESPDEVYEAVLVAVGVKALPDEGPHEENRVDLKGDVFELEKDFRVLNNRGRKVFVNKMTGTLADGTIEMVLDEWVEDEEAGRAFDAWLKDRYPKEPKRGFAGYVTRIWDHEVGYPKTMRIETPGELLASSGALSMSVTGFVEWIEGNGDTLLALHDCAGNVLFDREEERLPGLESQAGYDVYRR